jgi:hypothetical protein
MMDITHWLEKVQRRDLSAYYANLRHYLTAVNGSANPSLHQATQRFGMPKSLDAYHDSVVMCHPWDGIGLSLPPMLEGAETSMVLWSLCCRSWLNTCLSWIPQSWWLYTALIIPVSRSPMPPATCCRYPDPRRTRSTRWWATWPSPLLPHGQLRQRAGKADPGLRTP